MTICRLRATMPGLSIGGAQRAVEDTLRTRLAEQLKRLEVCGSPTAQAGGQVEPESAHAEQRVRTHRGREAVVTPVPLPQYWPISYDPASAARIKFRNASALSLSWVQAVENRNPPNFSLTSWIL